MSDGEAHPLPLSPTEPLQAVPASQEEPSQEIDLGSVFLGRLPSPDNHNQHSVRNQLTLDIPNRFLSPRHSQNPILPLRNTVRLDGGVVSNDVFQEYDIEDSIPGTPEIEQFMPDGKAFISVTARFFH
jgi:hypothetical protein